MKKNNKTKIENLDIFLSFLLLGLTSFGGPIAHIGYFRNFFVKQKKWLDDKLYADFISLCNFLPGPSSSQVGISIGYYFKGIKGAILAWIGFTTPSVIILMLFGYAILNYDSSIPQGVLKGLKAIVVVIVFQAILGMSKNLLKDNMGGYGSEKNSSDLSFNFNTGFLFKHARTRNRRDQNSGDARSSIQAIK